MLAGTRFAKLTYEHASTLGCLLIAGRPTQVRMLPRPYEPGQPSGIHRSVARKDTLSGNRFCRARLGPRQNTAPNRDWTQPYTVTRVWLREES